MADATPGDAKTALDAAAEAQRSWGRTSPRQRADILSRAFQEMSSRADELVVVLTLVLLKAGARHVPHRGEAKPLQRAVVIFPVAEDGARGGRPASQLGRGDCSLLLEESGRVPGGLERPGLVREDLTRGARAFARVSSLRVM